MKSISLLTISLYLTLGLFLLGAAEVPIVIDPECKLPPCARPLCDNPKQTTIIQDGKVCPGCPVCPPDNNCKDLEPCQLRRLCPEIDPFECRNIVPTCGFLNNEFCRDCDRCQTCKDIDCPKPKGGCTKFEPLKLESGEICKDCDICVTDFTPCPEILCLPVDPNCPEDKKRFNPLHLNGRICLGCTTCLQKN